MQTMSTYFKVFQTFQAEPLLSGWKPLPREGDCWETRVVTPSRPLVLSLGCMLQFPGELLRPAQAWDPLDII